MGDCVERKVFYEAVMLIRRYYFQEDHYHSCLELKKAVTKLFGFKESDLILTDNSELIPAIGAALSANFDKYKTTIDDYLTLLKKIPKPEKNLYKRYCAPVYK